MLRSVTEPEITDSPRPEDVEELSRRLGEYNRVAAGSLEQRELAAFIRSDGAIVAGVHGWSWGKATEIDYLWVSEERRGDGLGSALLEAAEREARTRGSKVMVLTTFSFQAPEFYVRRGWQIVGSCPGYPEGATHFMLRKELTQEGGQSG